MSTILVTGGAGFIGSYLCEPLLASGHRVLCADNLSSGSRENVKTLLKHPQFRFIEHNVQVPLKLSEPVDAIYHLASRASPADFGPHGLDILMTNSIGTLNLLNLAKEHRAKLLFASTSEVYGEPAVSPQPETYWGNVNPNGPRSVYDESKRFGEALCMAFHRTHGLDVRIARLFNTFGPRMRMNDGRVVPNFILQALADKPLTLYGDGSQTRSMCYVTDTVSGLIALMTKAPPASVTNIGTDRELTMRELAELVLKLTESKSKLAKLPALPDDPTRRKPELGRAKALGWSAQVSLEDGLRETIAYYQARLPAEGCSPDAGPL